MKYIITSFWIALCTLLLAACSHNSKVQCPSSDDITCKGTTCTVSGDYAKYWQAQQADAGVAKHPEFGGVFAAHGYVCNYKKLTLKSKNNKVVADTKAKNNQWESMLGVQMCGAFNKAIGHPDACPFKLKP